MIFTTNIVLYITVDLDEAARFEPPYQDLRCLQPQIFPTMCLNRVIRFVLQIQT